MSGTFTPPPGFTFEGGGDLLESHDDAVGSGVFTRPGSSGTFTPTPDATLAFQQADASPHKLLLYNPGGQLVTIESYADPALTTLTHVKALTYAGFQLNLITLTREVDAAQFEKQLTYTGDELSRIDVGALV